MVRDHVWEAGPWNWYPLGMRIRGVTPKEGLETSREEFNSYLPALGAVFQIIVREDPEQFGS